MASISKNGASGPSPSRAESKSDTTTRIARAITDSEYAKQAAKTERLRLARLAKEAEAATAPPAPKQKSRAR